MARFDTIEGINEVPLRRIIVDVRTNDQIFFDWLCYPRNFSKAMFVCAALCLLLPILLPVMAIVVVIFKDKYRLAAQYMPIRYPAWCGENDPGQLDPGTDLPSASSGIMYMGVVDANDPYERGKQVFLSADDLTRHMLVLGTTGSGKSELLKGMIFNVLCWASGFFVSDAKADNKLPTDVYSQVRMFLRDYDYLVINYLLGGLSPSEIASMRERLSNGVQPATAADADTLVQMTSNMMVKASGDSKTWQERGLNLFRGTTRALCHKRDNGELTLSLEVLRDYLSLDKIEELYIEGWKLANEGQGAWPTPYLGVKTYLEVGCPGFKIDIMLRKHGLLKEEEDDPAAMMAAAMRQVGGGKKPPTTQSNETYNQHGYRSDQVYPALSLLIDTYGHIFKRKHPEVDMQDVVVNNRICVSLIPSLEKGSQEQESLGKLNLALLRVMMARALGKSVEGDAEQIVDAKITAAPTPFALFLDEFAYQFAEGIALTAAQARSLNFFLCALAQDLEKLTEGERMAEAGAMMANQASKFFMKIVGSDKTHELAQKTLGEAQVAVLSGFEREGGLLGAVRRDKNYRIEKKPRIEREVLENLPPGFATFAYRRRAHVMRTFYPSGTVPKVRFPRINRFLQMPDMGDILLATCTVDMFPNEDKLAIEQVKKRLGAPDAPEYDNLVISDVVRAVIDAAKNMNPATPAIERGIVLYQAGIEALEHVKTGASLLRGASGGMRATPGSPNVVAESQQQQAQATAAAAGTQQHGHTEVAQKATSPVGPSDAALAEFEAVITSETGTDGAATPEAAEVDPDVFLESFDPVVEAARQNPPLVRKDKEEVFPEEVAMLAAQNPEPPAQPEPAERSQGVVGIDESGEALGVDDMQDADLILGDSESDNSLVDAGSAETGATAPVAEPHTEDRVSPAAVERVREDITALAATQINPTAVANMGDKVVGLRDDSLKEIANLEVAIGATQTEADKAAMNVQKAVAQGLSLPAADKADLSSLELESLFSELEDVLDTKK